MIAAAKVAAAGDDSGKPSPLIDSRLLGGASDAVRAWRHNRRHRRACIRHSKIRGPSLRKNSPFALHAGKAL